MQISCAGMVVHPSPGHTHGTLVNAVLHHYSLPAVSLASAQNLDSAVPTDQREYESMDASTCEEISDDEFQPLPQNSDAVIRPGIVHRLDKGTTGLMIVCRSDVALLKLGEQFRQRTVLLIAMP